MRSAAVGKLFERHHLAVFRYLRRMSRRQHLAEDLTQETFLRAARSVPLDRHQGHEAAWLFTIARNLFRDHQRRQTRRPQPVDLDVAQLMAIDGRQHLSLSLDEALNRLDGDDREVFLLRELGGLGYREIAAVMELTPDAVRSRIHRARMALREILIPSLQRARSRMKQEAL